MRPRGAAANWQQEEEVLPLTLGADNYRGCPGSCCKSPGSERAACDRSRSPFPMSPLLGGLDLEGIWGWEGAESRGEHPPGRV